MTDTFLIERDDDGNPIEAKPIIKRGEIVAYMVQERREVVERIAEGLGYLDWTDEQAAAINRVLDEAETDPRTHPASGDHPFTPERPRRAVK